MTEDIKCLWNPKTIETFEESAKNVFGPLSLVSLLLNKPKERSDFLNINCGGKKLFMANWK